jgi:hypothetical protein
MSNLAWSSVLVLSLVACGGSVFQEGDGGPGPGPGSDGSPSADGGGGPVCPANKPSSGGACSPVGIECEYGSDPNANCNTLMRCASNGWIDMTPGNICPPPGSICPPSYQSVPVNQDCMPEGLTCPYSQGVCYCTRSSFGPVRMKPAWECVPVAPGCPSTRPHLGTSCSQAGLQCDYGACLGGIALVCQSGYWQQADVACAQ